MKVHSHICKFYSTQLIISSVFAAKKETKLKFNAVRFANHIRVHVFCQVANRQIQMAMLQTHTISPMFFSFFYSFFNMMKEKLVKLAPFLQSYGLKLWGKSIETSLICRTETVAIKFRQIGINVCRHRISHEQKQS